MAFTNTFVTSHNSYLFFGVRTFKIWSPSNFEAYNVLSLPLIAVLCVSCPKLTHLPTACLYPLTNISPISPSPQLLVIAILLSVLVSLAYSAFHMYMRSYRICLSLLDFSCST